MWSRRRQPAVNAALEGLTRKELSWDQHNAAPTLQNVP